MATFLTVLLVAFLATFCVLIGYRLWWSAVVWWNGRRHRKSGLD